MAESKDNIIEVHHLSKLYGPNREAAVRMMKQGSDKDEVFKKKSEMWMKNLRKDSYLQEAMNIVADMKTKA